jgi:hypothetical protein
VSTGWIKLAPGRGRKHTKKLRTGPPPPFDEKMGAEPMHWRLDQHGPAVTALRELQMRLKREGGK